MLQYTEKSQFQNEKTMFLPKSHLVLVVKKCCILCFSWKNTNQISQKRFNIQWLKYFLLNIIFKILWSLLVKECWSFENNETFWLFLWKITKFMTIWCPKPWFPTRDFEKHKNGIFVFTTRNAWFSGWFYAQTIGWNGCLALINKKITFLFVWNATSIWTQMDEKLEKKTKNMIFSTKKLFLQKHH